MLELTQALIKKASVTPHDEGCQNLVIDYLKNCGCRVTPLPYKDVTNLWVEHGEGQPLLAFAGHTDVVPTGPLDEWRFPPFEPTIHEGYLYGRGAQDMKAGVAAMTVAMKHFITQHPNHKGRVALLLTSAEEGQSYMNGTPHVVEYLKNNNDQITWCIVGEPSSTHHVGDLIRTGRRGSLKGYLRIHGKQGHVAYSHMADNPIHKALPALTELINTPWDEGNSFFPPTSFQISNIQAGTGAINVIPNDIYLKMSFRYSSEITNEDINKKMRAILDKYHLNYKLNWELSGKPFLTKAGPLIESVRNAIKIVTGREPQFSTGGGTSDGRFIAPTGAEVIELGVCNDRIHQINERVKLEDLEHLGLIYEKVIQQLLE